MASLSMTPRNPLAQHPDPSGYRPAERGVTSLCHNTWRRPHLGAAPLEHSVGWTTTETSLGLGGLPQGEFYHGAIARPRQHGPLSGVRPL